MTTKLSSLRVTADLDTSGYVRGAQAKTSADQKMADSSSAVGAALAQADARLDKAIPGMARISKALLEGYSAGQAFEKAVTSIGMAVDRGMGIDRANLLLDAAYRKFGLTAESADLARRGYVSLSPVVEQLNNQLSIQNEILARNQTAQTNAARAAAAQGEINARLNVREIQPGSAKESADAFLADVGGIDGLAKERARQIGQSFQDGLNEHFGVNAIGKSARDSAAVFNAELKRTDDIARLRAEQIGQSFQDGLNERFGVNSIGKSAKESASVFDAELKKMDDIAKMRAEQIGADFQDQLNQRLNIGGPSATSQGATFSALEEQLNQLDEIARARAAHNAQVSQTGINSSFGIDNEAKSARDSAAIFEEAAREADSLDKATAALMQQIDPLAAAQERLNAELAQYQKLADTGRISTEDFAKASQLANERFHLTQVAIQGVGGVSRFTSFELVNLSYQLNDVVTGILLGQSPFMIMAQQGGQVVGILQNSKGGIAGSLQSIGSLLVGLVTPARVAAVGIAGVGAAFALAQSNSSSFIRESSRAFTGIGAAAGVSIAQIDRVAQANSALTTLSVSQAREAGLAFASTGKIGGEMMARLVGITHDFAATLGVSVPEATKTLAEAFADPVHGAEQLNAKLGFLDGSMLRGITNLQAQNRLLEAQRILADGVQSSLGKAEQFRGPLESLWTVFANATSNVINPPISQMVGNLEAEVQRLKGIQSDPNWLQRILGIGGPDDAALANRIKELQNYLDKLNKVSARSVDAQLDQRSLVVRNAVNQASPEFSKRDALENMRNVLAEAEKTVNAEISQTGESPLLKKLGFTREQLAQAARTADFNFGTFKSEIDKTISQSKIGIDAITARSPTAKADIARRQSLAGYEGTDADPTKVKVQSELAYTHALKEANFQLSEQARERKLTADQSSRSAELDITLVGKSVEETTKLQAVQQAKYDLEREASQNRTKFDQKQLDALTLIIQKQAMLKQLAEETKLQNDISFERSQIGLSDTEQQINSKLRAIYGKDLNSDQAQFFAQQLRINDTLKEFSDSGRDAFKGLITDFRNGVAAGQAFTNVVNKIADKLLDMALNNIWGRAFGTGTSGANGGIGNFLGSLFGAGGAGFGVGQAPGNGAGATLYSSPIGPTQSGAPLGFAMGGIMTPYGSLPLRKYAGGGVANSPQVAIFGEGRMNEAYVPLPDGRTIPVSINVPSAPSGPTGGGIQISHTVKNYAPVDVQTKRSRDGMSMETIIRPLEDAMAGRAARGQGSLGKTVIARGRNQGLRG